MSQLMLRRKVNVPADRMWEVISSYDRLAVPEPECANEKCAPQNNAGFRGAAVRWAKRRGYRVSIGHVSMPFKRSKIGVSVRHAGAEESEVTITMDYAVKYGPLGSLMNLFVMRPLMRRMFVRSVDEMVCLSRSDGNTRSPARREGRLMEAKTVFA